MSHRLHERAKVACCLIGIGVLAVVGATGSPASVSDCVSTGTMTIRVDAGGGGRCELQYPDTDGVYTTTIGGVKRLGREYFEGLKKRMNATCEWEDVVARVSAADPDPAKPGEVDDATILGVCRVLWQAGITKTQLDVGTTQLDVRPRRDAGDDPPSIRILESGVVVCRPVVVGDKDVSKSLKEPPVVGVSSAPEAIVLAASKSNVGWGRLRPILAELVDGGVRTILIEER